MVYSYCDLFFYKQKFIFCTPLLLFLVETFNIHEGWWPQIWFAKKRKVVKSQKKPKVNQIAYPTRFLMSGNKSTNFPSRFGGIINGYRMEKLLFGRHKNNISISQEPNGLFTNYVVRRRVGGVKRKYYGCTTEVGGGVKLKY